VFAVISAGALYAFYYVGIDFSNFLVETMRLASMPALIAIPLFTFAGYVLAESNAPKRALNLANSLFGWMPGGLAIVALCTAAIFTAFTGASGITIIALGGLLYPMLTKQGYPENFNLGLLTTTGSLGLLFPPSLPIILYGLVAQISIDKLFKAAAIPGILLIIMLCTYALITGKKAHIPSIPFSMSNLKKAVRESIWEIPLPFLVIGGIYAGWFTATDAASIMAFYVVICEFFIYKDLSITKDLPKITTGSMVLVGAIFMVLASALGLTNYFIDEQIPEKIFSWLHTVSESKIIFLVILNIFLLIINMIEIFSAIIIVVPIITPIAASYGIDPIHLGIIFLLNLEIGYMTPPFGLNLFLANRRFEKPLSKLYVSVIKFWVMMVIALLVVTYFPPLSLWLIK